MERYLRKKVIKDLKTICCFFIFCSFIFQNCVSNHSDVTKEELSAILTDDIKIFVNKSIPYELLDVLGNKKVVIFGECHRVKEHQELAGKLMIALNKDYNFNQIFLEWAQTLSWIFEEDMQENPKIYPYNKYYRILTDRISSYNQKNANNRIVVKCLDYNPNDRIYRDSLSLMTLHLARTTKIDKIVADIKELKGKAYTDYLENLHKDLSLYKDEYVNDLSLKYYSYVKIMTVVEIESINIRSLFKESNKKGFIARENLLKKLADQFISENSGNTMIYIGNYHSQKKRYMGTNQEWLGDYLSHISPITKNNAFCLHNTGVKGTHWNSSTKKYENFSTLDSSSKNEIFRITNELVGNQVCFIPLADIFFDNNNINVCYIKTQLSIPIKKQYDGYILFPQLTTF